MPNPKVDVTIEPDDMLEGFEFVPLKQEVILSLLNGNTVHTFCPPGTTLEQAKANYLPKGAEDPKVMTDQEVATVFLEEG
jgi:hypothetical protein